MTTARPPAEAGPASTLTRYRTRTNDDNPDDPAPVCAHCGGNLGIFLKFGLDWRHYRGDGMDNLELYDPGHAPKLTWRVPTPAHTPAFPASKAP